MENIKTVVLLVIIIYATVISVLYWTEHSSRDQYQKDKDIQLKNKEIELDKRESIIVDKEICFRELTKLKTVQTSALDILKAYHTPYTNTYEQNNKNNKIKERVISDSESKTKSEEQKPITKWFLE